MGIMIKFKKLDERAIPFRYTREEDACMDMFVLGDSEVQSGETKLIDTGIAVEIPIGYEGIVRGRSGLAMNGIVVHFGTIDHEYRGSMGIILTNAGKETFKIKHGMRLAQFTVKPVFSIKMVEVKELSETERGVNGYGSSKLI